jgi:hypothetical protein
MSNFKVRLPRRMSFLRKQESRIKSKTQELLDTRLRGYDRMVEFIFLIRILAFDIVLS